MRLAVICLLSLFCSALFSQSSSINLDDAAASFGFTAEKESPSATLMATASTSTAIAIPAKPSTARTTTKTSAVKSSTATVKKAINVFPDPSYDKLNLNAGSFNFNHIFVSTMNGRIKLEQRIDPATSTKIDVSHLKKGTYLVTLRSGSKEKEQYFTVK